MTNIVSVRVPFRHEPTLLFAYDEFLVACEVDKDYEKEGMSVGIRWNSSRNEKNSPNPMGFPVTINKITKERIRCWFKLPNYLAIPFLSSLLGRTQECYPNGEMQIVKTIQKLVEQNLQIKETK